MSKTVTLRLNEKVYNMFRNLAGRENRTLSNFIETSVLRFVEQNQYELEKKMNEHIVLFITASITKRKLI